MIMIQHSESTWNVLRAVIDIILHIYLLILLCINTRCRCHSVLWPNMTDTAVRVILYMSRSSFPIVCRVRRMLINGVMYTEDITLKEVTALKNQTYRRSATQIEQCSKNLCRVAIDVAWATQNEKFSTCFRWDRSQPRLEMCTETLPSVVLW